MDKRPLGFIGAVFFTTLLVFTRFGMEKSLYIIPIFLVAVFLIFLAKNKLRFFSVFAASVFCASTIFFAANNTFRANEVYFSGENISVEGTVWEKPYIKNDKNYVVVKTEKVNGESISMKIRVNVLDLPRNAEINSKVKFRANLYQVSELDSSASYLKSRNICLVGNCKANTFTVFGDSAKTLRYYLIAARYKICDTISSLLPNDIGGFISGIVLGETDMLDDERMEGFRITGTSHILVVSGLHVAIWSGFLYKIFSLVLKKGISSLLSIIFLVFYMTFTGFTPSVVRAGTMMILNYFAVLFDEKPDHLNLLGITAIVITAVDPFSLYNVGTIFSFASVLGILLMNEYIYKKIRFEKISSKYLRKIAETITSLIFVSLSAQIFTYPIAVLYNINFSFLSVITNFFITFLTTVTMVSGGVGAILLTVFSNGIIGRIIMSVSIFLSKIIFRVVRYLSSFDDFYVNVTDFENYILLSLVFLVIFLLMLSGRKIKSAVQIFLLLLVPVFLLSNYIPHLYKSSFIEMSVIDVGHGLCVAFTNKDESVLLGCGGTFSALTNITEHLEERKVENIKAVYLSPDDSMSQMNSARKIKDIFNVESVVAPAEYDFSYISENGIYADYVMAEYFDGRLRLDFYTEKNESFVLVTAGNERILVNFYGKLNEENLPQGCINPDIYVTMSPNTYDADCSCIGKYIISTEYETSVAVSAKDVHVTMNDGKYIKPILI